MCYSMFKTMNDKHYYDVLICEVSSSDFPLFWFPNVIFDLSMPILGKGVFAISRVTSCFSEQVWFHLFLICKNYISLLCSSFLEMQSYIHLRFWDMLLIVYTMHNWSLMVLSLFMYIKTMYKGLVFCPFVCGWFNWGKLSLQLHQLLKVSLWCSWKGNYPITLGKSFIIFLFMGLWWHK